MNNLTDLKVLYVEDEYLIRETVKSILEYSFLSENIFTANNGKEGFDIFKSKRPDIVLTDIKMQPLDGIEMSRAIREIDANVPIIIISAFEKEFFEFDNLNIHDYIIKPINRFVLIKTLEKIIENM